MCNHIVNKLLFLIINYYFLLLSAAVERILELEGELAKKKEEVLQLQAENTQTKVSLAASTEERMKQVRDVEEKLRKDLQSSHDKIFKLEESRLALTEDLNMKRDEVVAGTRELEYMKLMLSGLQERLANVLSEKNQSFNNANMQELQSVRDQNKILQQNLENERKAKIDALSRLTESESEWDKLAEQVIHSLFDSLFSTKHFCAQKSLLLWFYNYIIIYCY